MNKRKYILVAIILILLILIGIIIYLYHNKNTDELSLKNIVKFKETLINNVVVDINREETENNEKNNNDEKNNTENKEETNIKSNSNTEKQKVEEKNVNQSSTEKEKNSNSSIAKQKETNSSSKTNTETKNVPTNEKEQNTVTKNETVSNKETSQNKNENENKSTETETKKEEIIENPDLANTHFTKYSKTKTQHAVDYINSKIKEDELYEKLGGKAIVVTEKPTDFWFSYTGDFKLDGLCLAGLIVKVYVEEEYVYDSKGINSYLYDTKAYIYQTQE